MRTKGTVSLSARQASSAVLGILIAAVQLLVVFLGAPQSKPHAKCPDAPILDSAPPSLGATAAQVELSAAGGFSSNPRSDFRISRAIRRIGPVKLTASKPLTTLDVLKVDIDLVTKQGDSFPSVVPTLASGVDKTHFKLRLCLDPRDARAGEYVGTIDVGGAGIKMLQIPMTVTVQDKNGVIWSVLLALAVTAAAIFYRWAVNRPAGTLWRDIKEFRNYLANHYLNAAVAIILGSSAWLLTYRTSLSFGANIEDYITLIGAIFGTVVTVLVPAKPSDQRSPQGGPSPPDGTA